MYIYIYIYNIYIYNLYSSLKYKTSAIIFVEKSTTYSRSLV